MRKDMDDDEKENVWLLPHEYQDIKRSLHMTVQLMRSGDPLQVLDREDSVLCTRGLEWEERESSNEFSRQSCRKRSLQAVWQEQSSQWQEGRIDPERLAAVYERSTETSKAIAHWLALMNSNDVMKNGNNAIDHSRHGFTREVDDNSSTNKNNDQSSYGVAQAPSVF
jgi:hypothetical protein